MARSEIIQHEILSEENEHYLHVYLKDGLEPAYVELSFSSTSDGCVSVHLDSADSKISHGKIIIKGFALPEDAQARYKKAKRRYTIRLVKSQKAVLPDDDVDETFHDALSDEEVVETSVTATEAHGQGALDSGSDEAVTEGMDEETRRALRKERKKAKKSQKKAAKAEGITAECSDAPKLEDFLMTESHQEADATGVKKKKRKKKKGTAASSAVTDADNQVAGDDDEAVEAESLTTAVPTSKGQEAPGEPATSAVPIKTAVTDPPQPDSPPVREARGASMPTPSPPPTPSRAAFTGSKPVTVDLVQDFSVEPTGVSSLGPLSATKAADPDPFTLTGPHIKFFTSKNDHKGEDKALLSPQNTWSMPSVNGSAPFSAFGVFDGHGGKAAANYASKNMMELVGKYMDRCKGSEPVLLDPANLPVDLGEEQRASLAVQDVMVERFPKALFAGFVEANKVCMERYKESGTTATLVVAVGWTLLVASVGDSLAFLDTGTEILQISGNHRVSDCPEEAERVRQAGGHIAQSDIDGVVAGPLRVWPGGLMMTRSIGDAAAGDLCLGEPEVRQVTIPPNGARLIIASDGLWDAVQHKTAISNIRKMPAGQAANMAMHAAIKKKGLVDDITIVVVDFCCNPEDRFPVALEAGRRRDGSESTQVLRPLDMPSNTWRESLAERRMSIMGTMQVAEQHDREQAAAAERLAADQRAASSTSHHLSNLHKVLLSGDETLQELSNLRVDVSSLHSLVEEQHPPEEDGEWQTVSGKLGSTNVNLSNKGEEGMDYMQQIRAAARPLRGAAGGNGEAADVEGKGGIRGRGEEHERGGKGRGRSGRGGEGRGGEGRGGEGRLRRPLHKSGENPAFNEGESQDPTAAGKGATAEALPEDSGVRSKQGLASRVGDPAVRNQRRGDRQRRVQVEQHRVEGDYGLTTIETVITDPFASKDEGHRTQVTAAPGRGPRRGQQQQQQHRRRRSETGTTFDAITVQPDASVAVVSKTVGAASSVPVDDQGRSHQRNNRPHPRRDQMRSVEEKPSEGTVIPGQGLVSKKPGEKGRFAVHQGSVQGYGANLDPSRSMSEAQLQQPKGRDIPRPRPFKPASNTNAQPVSEGKQQNPSSRQYASRPVAGGAQPQEHAAADVMRVIEVPRSALVRNQAAAQSDQQKGGYTGQGQGGQVPQVPHSREGTGSVSRGGRGAGNQSRHGGGRGGEGRSRDAAEADGGVRAYQPALDNITTLPTPLDFGAGFGAGFGEARRPYKGASAAAPATSTHEAQQHLAGRGKSAGRGGPRSDHKLRETQM
ncbi:hypothetical protein CEUSTIGMA_g8937.t1 [Chlamydomonas eustigma]|uniref:PPM-type phosphatase domain-containing protein n=1 Tax=Chlamydomonas eustigma TaxID=1157962 RepID=A0A250XF22_9CHLO|nr:hypothetical protein CEUSTIGMA_g8937.t1 [Chlamydomonas eustigma]|eukprot:GAX81509.1 hypothetical protein CEUSTIGMA_g8937.t1 [Chlamydomonas eustigma]